MTARFTPTYSLIVLAVTAALALWAWYLIGVLGAGWTWRAGTLTVTENTLKLVLLVPLMVALFATQAWTLLRRPDILVLTASGLHDRRLTRGAIPWHQIARITVYRKGWQPVARIDLKPLTTPGRDLDLGPMPLYAFNRLCARWLKRPELVVGLGGLSVPSTQTLLAIGTHFAGELQVE